MRTIPYRLNTDAMARRLAGMNDYDRVTMVQNLIRYRKDGVLYSSDLRRLAQDVSLRVEVIVLDIMMKETEDALFAYADDVDAMQRLGFLPRCRTVQHYMNRQLRNIYKKQF